MNTNPVNNVNSSAIPASVDAQTLHAPVLELVQFCETSQFTEAYHSQTGHCVTVTTKYYPAITHLTIQVSTDYGCVMACDVSFRGINHEEDYETFLESYMNSPALYTICENFDELCTWYEDDDEDEE